MDYEKRLRLALSFITGLFFAGTLGYVFLEGWPWLDAFYMAVITLTARSLNPNLFITARVEEPLSEKKLLRAGANKVVLPYLIGGNRLAYAVLKPALVDFLEIATQRERMDLIMEEITVKTGSRLKGKSLKESRISHDLEIMVVAIKREDKMVFNPSADTEIEQGDKLIVLGSERQLKGMEEWAQS